MYEEFFGFSRRPFSLTPDPEFLYWTDQHRNAFDLVCMSLLRRAPIAVITGDVGAGKTTLLQALLQEISEEFEVGLLSNVAGDSGELLRWILTAFGHDSTPSTRAEATREVEALLALKWEEGRRCVLVIDEAQNVSDHGIETLRLLTNMDVGKCAPLSLIVAGQPELRDRLAGPSFSAFRQRLGASYHLGPMTPEETAGYIRNRIGVAGGKQDVIDDGAIEAIHRRAGGVPRLTNLLCDLCLVTAFGEDRTRIDAGFAEAVLAEGLALGGLGGLPAEAETAEPAAEVVMRRAAASGSPRAFGIAPFAVEDAPKGGLGRRGGAGGRPPLPSLRLVSDQHDEGRGAEEEPLPLTRRARVERGSAETVIDAAAAPVLALAQAARAGRARRVSGGQVVRRVIGSVAGLGVAASVAAAALVLPAAGTDVGQMPMSAVAPMMNDSAKPDPAGLSVAGHAAPATEGPLGIVEAQLAAPDPGGAERLFERALEGAGADPSAAAINYSRAAARGHGRAAYYLAQMYETGDGVPFAPDTAWNWYAAAADVVPAAGERLDELAALATAEGAVAAPIYSASDGGIVELVWQGRGSFVVELAPEPDAVEGTVVHTTALTAARLEVPESIGWWRVRAVGAEPSEWTRLGMPAAY